MSIALAISSGQVVTSGATLTSAAPFTVAVPSYAAAGWSVEFGVTANDSSAFAPRMRDDGSGGVLSIFSGTAGCWSAPIMPPSPHFRIRSTTSATTVASLLVVPVFVR